MAINIKMKSLEWNKIFIPGFIPQEDEEEVADSTVDEATIKKHIKYDKMSAKEKALTGLPFRMLYHYARINPELPNKKGTPTFEKNFWKAFSGALGQKATKEDFSNLIDSMFNVNEELKETKKVYNKAHAKERKEHSQQMKAKYGTAIVNGKDEDISNYVIEGEGIFFGRGNSPFNGLWKFQVQPEDISINWISSKPAPIAPNGHKWKSVDRNPNRHEIATYYMRVGIPNANGKDEILDERRKKIQFAPSSSIKKEAEKAKYAKASSLASRYEDFCKYIDKGLESKDTEQQAFVAWLIQQTGLRIGNESGEDGQSINGTVGAATIKVKNMTLSGDQLHLSFLGKDSVPYDNTITVKANALPVLKRMIDGKSKDDNIVDVSLQSIAEFLHSFDKDLTPKLIRTQVANYELRQSLARLMKENKVTKSSTDAQKLNVFKLANLEVAKALNHQKNVSKNFEASYEKAKDKLGERKDKLVGYLEKQNKRLAHLKKLKKNASAPDTAEVYAERIRKIEDQVKAREASIENAASRLILKRESKNIALGTSLNAYISPSEVIAWCQDVDLPVEKIYNKTQLKKFDWALKN